MGRGWRAPIVVALPALLLACATHPAEPPRVLPYPVERLVIITADDFGASTNINRGIMLAAQQGVITAVSAMTNFPGSLEELRQLHALCPQIGIGVHLNITTGSPVLPPERLPSLVRPDGSFYPIEELLLHLQEVSLPELEQELAAQIDQLHRLGIPVDHLSNQHGILSLYAPFFEVVLELAQRQGLPVRTPLAGSVLYPRLYPGAGTQRKGASVAGRLALTSPFRAMRLLKYASRAEMLRNAARLDERGIRHPDLLVDYLYGRPSAETVFHILENLPEGIVEIVLHLGTYERDPPYPPGLDLQYFRNREGELLLVTSEYLKQYFSFLNLRGIRFADLP
jgi:hypothetical protein